MFFRWDPPPSSELWVFLQVGASGRRRESARRGGLTVGIGKKSPLRFGKNCHFCILLKSLLCMFLEGWKDNQHPVVRLLTRPWLRWDTLVFNDPQQWYEMNSSQKGRVVRMVYLQIYNLLHMTSKLEIAPRHVQTYGSLISRLGYLNWQSCGEFEPNIVPLRPRAWMPTWHAALSVRRRRTCRWSMTS